MALTNQYDKIVFNFDGNNNDVDDIGAMPMAGLLASSDGIEDKTTFFYNNNLSEKNNDSQVDKMRSSAAMVEKMGIETIDYQQNIDSATDKLVNTFNSGQTVLVLEGGPMEATYRALNKTNESNLNNITLVSHSDWNEERDVITRDGVSQARTWDDIKDDFPVVNTIQIADGNGDDNSGPKGFYSDGWNWLDSKKDAIYTEVREHMKASGKPNDVSDADMLFYAITGDEYGDPWDAKSFLETNPPHFVVEDPTQTPSNNDEYDIRVDYEIEPGWNNNSLTAEISFLNKGDSFQGWEMGFKANYNIVNIDNAEILSHQGDTYVIGDLSINDNVYENEVTTFSFTAEGDFSEKPQDWKFNEQELKNWEVDTEIPDNNSTPNPDNNDNYWKIEAEDMQLSSQYKIENNNYASGGRLISLLGGNSNSDTGYAGFQFGGEEGTYNIKIAAFDENDGEGRIEMAQGTNFLKGFDLDRNSGSNIADSSSAVTLEIKNVFVEEGDYFRLTGIEDGNKYTTEPARIDYVEMIPVDTSF